MQIESRWNRIARLWLSAVVVLFPLCWYPYAYFAYEQPQALAWRAGALFFIVFVVLGVLHSQRLRLPRLPIWVQVIAVVYFAAVIISTVTSWSWVTALWGSQYRFQGIVLLLLHLLAAGGVYQLLSVQRRQWWWHMAVSLSGTAVAVYGIAQRFGLDPWSHPLRIHGTFGHANFLGAYLVITLATLTGLLYTRKRYWWWAIPMALVQWTALWLTLTRTAWAAGLVVLLVIAVAQAVWIGAQKKWLTWLLVTAVAFIIAVAGFFITRTINSTAQVAYTATQSTTVLSLVLEDAANNTIEANPLDHRLQSITNPSSGSGAVRWYIWKDSWDIIKDNWLFGVGNDSMHVRYPEYYRGEAGRPLIARSTYTDRAHNDVLDTWLAYGVFGMLAKYILIIWLVVTAIVWGVRHRATATEEQRLLLSAGLAGIIATVAFNQLGFAVTATNALSILSGTVVLFVVRPFEERTLTVPKPSRLFSVVIILCTVAAVFRYSVQPMMASVNAFSYRDTSVASDVVEDKLRQAIQLDPNMAQYEYLLAQLYLEAAYQLPVGLEAAQMYERAVIAADGARDKGLILLENWDFKIRAYDAWGAMDANYLPKKRKFEELIWSRIQHFGDLHKQYDSADTTKKTTVE